ncbi:Protein URA2 [Durusdinium trenchii]|uniref:Protein URA2 n=1 Tax=Durusdinium trenchii TaxID=1381693 RepID=A0ABP0HVZ4_9DINO
MAQGAKAMAYTPPPTADGTPRPVVPCVRLGVLMEAAIPKRGTDIDPSYASKLEAVIRAFKDEDAAATTNGGEGYPYWVMEDFQNRAGCCCEQCCCCCCFAGTWSSCPETCRTSYLVNPNHPLKCFLGCNWLADLCCCLGIHTYSGDPDPWKPYAVGGEGNPALMNVGNASIRMNNTDNKWGSLITSAQVQNLVPRLYNSANNAADRAVFFEPFVAFAKFLCSLWDKYENVVAVELMNEPIIGGLPNLCITGTIWRQILSFQADVMEELDKDPSIKCPIAIANWSSTVEGESCFVSLLACAGTSTKAMQRFQAYAQQNRLLLSFHYYIPPSTSSFIEVIDLAKKNAIKLGRPPIFFSEFWEGSAQSFANYLAKAVDEGVNAVTYWQYADSDFTGQPGSYKYPESVTSLGDPVSAWGTINTPAWDAYSITVADGTFFGGDITGGGGAQMNVLELVPAEPQNVSLIGPHLAWRRQALSLQEGIHVAAVHIASLLGCEESCEELDFEALEEQVQICLLGLVQGLEACNSRLERLYVDFDCLDDGAAEGLFGSEGMLKEDLQEIQEAQADCVELQKRTGGWQRCSRRASSHVMGLEALADFLGEAVPEMDRLVALCGDFAARRRAAVARAKVRNGGGRRERSGRERAVGEQVER